MNFSAMKEMSEVSTHFLIDVEQHADNPPTKLFIGMFYVHIIAAIFQ